MEAKEEKMKKLYEVVEKSEGMPVPKRALFSWKCPKCGNKLSKKSAKDMIYTGEGASEFAKKVTAKAGVLQGVYNLTINHFTCQKCGYEFAQAEVEELSDS